VAPRVLITGAGGQLGLDLQDALSGTIPDGGCERSLLGGPALRLEVDELIALSHSELDVCDEAEVRAAVLAAKPDVIVHLAAYTAVDRAETEPELARQVNELGLRNVVRAAELAESHLISISTDYVFAGDLGRPLVESDPTGPLSVYGATKLAGELACGPAASILRTSWLAGVHGHGVISLAVDAARTGRELAFVDDQVGSPTAAADLAAGLSWFIDERPSGVFHVAGSGSANWHEVISFAVERAGGSRDQVRAIPTSSLLPPQAARRPPYSPLISERLGSAALPEWQDGFGRLVDAISEEGSR